MKKLAILAVLALAAMALTAYAAVGPGLLGPDEGGPVQNVGPAAHDPQGPPETVATVNPAGVEVALPEQAADIVSDKNQVWNGGAPGLTRASGPASDGGAGPPAEKPPTMVKTENPAGVSIELPQHALAIVSEKNPVWNGGAPGAEKRQGPAGNEGQGPPEKQQVCHKPGTPAAKTLKLPRPAAEHHKDAHKDSSGPCPS